jgi:hypothetical protein
LSENSGQEFFSPKQVGTQVSEASIKLIFPLEAAISISARALNRLFLCDSRGSVRLCKPRADARKTCPSVWQTGNIPIFLFQ